MTAGIATSGQVYTQVKGHEAAEPLRRSVFYPALGPSAPSSVSRLTSYLCIICYAHDAVGVVGRSSDFSRTTSAMSEAVENRNKESEVPVQQLLMNPVYHSLFLQPRSAIPLYT